MVEDITVLMIWETVMTATLFVGISFSSDMKKCPLERLHDFISDKYDASLCPESTMADARYVIMASG